MSKEARRLMESMFFEAGLPSPSEEQLQLMYQWDMSRYITVEQVCAVLAAFGWKGDVDVT